MNGKGQTPAHMKAPARRASAGGVRPVGGETSAAADVGGPAALLSSGSVGVSGGISGDLGLRGALVASGRQAVIVACPSVAKPTCCGRDTEASDETTQLAWCRRARRTSSDR